MSFTVMRYKDGVAAPIKMSIWDAFKGTPSSPARGPRPAAAAVKDCPCRHQKDHSSSAAATGGSGELVLVKHKHKPDEKEEGVKKATDAEVKNHSTREQETYTEDDNKKIIALKAEGKTWKEILQEIGKESQSQLKTHWKSINPDGPAAAAAISTPNADAVKKKDDTATTINDTKKEKNKPMTAEQEHWRAWSDRYDRHKWIAAASRHYDRTGQRITPAVARRLALGE